MRMLTTATAWRHALPMLALALLTACSRAPAPGAALPAPDLERVTVVAAQAPRELVWDGVVEAVNETTLAAQTNARVLELPVDVGDRVAAGDVLVRFSDVEQSSGRQSASAAVAAARAEKADAEANWQRIDEIYRRGLIARAELDAATARRDASRASLAAAEAALRSAGQAADYTVVRAPFAGVITRRMVEIGQAVQSGPPQPQPLLAMAALDALRAEVTLPESVVAALGSGATLLLAGGIAVPAGSVQVLPTADATTHTVRVRVGIPLEAGPLLPGATVKVAFAAGSAERLAVPASALQRRGEITGVYVIDAEQRMALRLVRPGRERADGVEILAGLAAGEEIARDAGAASAWLAAARRGKVKP